MSRTDAIRQFIAQVWFEIFKRKYDFWEIWEAISYLMKTGCQWRMLPKYYPPWNVVYYYFCKLRDEGWLEQLNDALVVELRKRANHPNDPSYVIIDSQTNRSDAFVREAVGYDGGKKMKGRKRHLAVDSQGFLIALLVHSAGIQDRKGFRELLVDIKSKFPSTKIVYVDGGYAGPIAETIAQELGFELRVVKRKPDQEGFEVLNKRWVVERTFGWFRQFRRLNREYEHTIVSAIATVHCASIALMLNRF
jgi:putative transposase